MYLRYSAIYTTVNIFHFICSVNDEAKTKDAILYATFSTPPNSIGGSAVCAFRLREVSDAFSGGFKEQRDMSANWLPVPENQVPSNPRPGSCHNDTKSLSDSYINFIKTHTLMDDSVSLIICYKESHSYLKAPESEIKCFT